MIPCFSQWCPQFFSLPEQYPFLTHPKNENPSEIFFGGCARVSGKENVLLGLALSLVREEDEVDEVRVLFLLVVVCLTGGGVRFRLKQLDGEEKAMPAMGNLKWSSGDRTRRTVLLLLLHCSILLGRKKKDHRKM